MKQKLIKITLSLGILSVLFLGCSNEQANIVQKSQLDSSNTQPNYTQVATNEIFDENNILQPITKESHTAQLRIGISAQFIGEQKIYGEIIAQAIAQAIEVSKAAEFIAVKLLHDDCDIAHTQEIAEDMQNQFQVDVVFGSQCASSLLASELYQKFEILYIAYIDDKRFSSRNLPYIFNAKVAPHDEQVFIAKHRNRSHFIFEKNALIDFPVLIKDYFNYSIIDSSSDDFEFPLGDIDITATTVSLLCDQLCHKVIDVLPLDISIVVNAQSLLENALQKERDQTGDAEAKVMSKKHIDTIKKKLLQDLAAIKPNIFSIDKMFAGVPKGFFSDMKNADYQQKALAWSMFRTALALIESWKIHKSEFKPLLQIFTEYQLKYADVESHFDMQGRLSNDDYSLRSINK